MAWLCILWPVSGWLAVWVRSPKWMRKSDPIGFSVVLIFCGAIGGPIMWLAP